MTEEPHNAPGRPGESPWIRKARAFAELARISNGLTVVSNVLVGVAAGGVMAGLVGFPWFAAAGMIAAILLLYAGGMALNDAVDLQIDLRERPQRPIPSGRITLRQAHGFALVCMLGGLVMAALFGFASGLLAAGIVLSSILYNLLHKRIAGAAIFMALCRGLVYLAAAAAVAWPLDWRVALPPALAMAGYIMLVTLIARSEAAADGQRTGTSGLAVRLSMVLIIIALSPGLWIAPGDWTWAVIAAIAAIVWLVAAQRFLIAQPARVPQAVMSFLAGICLIDAYYLALLEQPAMMVIAWACFVTTVFAHQRISGT